MTDEARMTFDDLWPIKPYGLTVVTGPHGVGKTVFALTTGARPERMLVLDGEQSARMYHEQLRFGRYVDLVNDAPGVTAAGVYRLVSKEVERMSPDRYDVVVLDNISPLEDGIAEYVERHPTEFGLTSGQLKGGLKWGAIKRVYRRLLLDLMAKAKMVIVTTHLGTVWAANGRPVPGLQKPKGKSTLEELAVLRLWLRFNPRSPVPQALVLKSRLTFFTPDGVMPALPRKLDLATWARIREYLADPSWRDRPEPGLTEEEVYMLRGTMTSEQMALYRATITMKQQDAEQDNDGDDSQKPVMKEEANIKETANLLASVVSRGVSVAEILARLQARSVADIDPDELRREFDV